MAPPKKKIDEDLLSKLAAIHCTMQEMSDVLGVSIDTLERRYAVLIKEKQSTGKMSLRRKLFEMANNGNLGACIWLSKQHLGMSEKVEQKQEVTSNQPTLLVTQWGNANVVKDKS